MTITFEYLDSDLKGEIEERRLDKHYFTEEELFGLVGNVAEAVSALL